MVITIFKTTEPHNLCSRSTDHNSDPQKLSATFKNNKTTAPGTHTEQTCPTTHQVLPALCRTTSHPVAEQRTARSRAQPGLPPCHRTWWPWKALGYKDVTTYNWHQRILRMLQPPYGSVFAHWTCVPTSSGAKAGESFNIHICYVCHIKSSWEFKTIQQL